jgi:glycosyltransferase involved in cell wall biosynthesis
VYKGLNCIAIVPAYNEQHKIGKVLRTIPLFIDEVFVINDGSTDDTSGEVVRHSTIDARITLKSNNENRGVGYSITRGYLYAVSRGINLSVILAGDGQMDPGYISRMFDLLIDKKLDVIKGNRLYFSKELLSMPILRLFGNLVLTMLNKICFRMWKLRDPQNGFVAIRLSSLEQDRILGFSSGYLFETEFLLMIKRHNLQIQDIKIPARYNSHSSSLEIKHLIFPLLKIYFKELFIIQKHYKRGS